MNYYKIIKNGVVIDANNVFLRYSKKHGTLVVCEPAQGEFIQSSDQSTVYRVDWLKPTLESVTSQYELAESTEIDAEEYKLLKAILALGETVDNPQLDSDSAEDEPEQLQPDTTLEYLKQLKMNEMSTACNAAIISGIDVVLSDGLQHHFSLSIEDQVNLISLSALIMQGQQVIPYHADGEACKYFSAEDIQSIVSAATTWKTYHEAYYNSLKAYVENINDIPLLSSIKYGIDIPLEFQSAVYQQFLVGNSTEVD